MSSDWSLILACVYDWLSPMSWPAPLEQGHFCCLNTSFAMDNYQLKEANLYCHLDLLKEPFRNHNILSPLMMLKNYQNKWINYSINVVFKFSESSSKHHHWDDFILISYTQTCIPAHTHTHTHTHTHSSCKPGNTILHTKQFMTKLNVHHYN